MTSLNIHRSPSGPKDRTIEGAVPWSGLPDLLFRCQGAYDSKAQKWKLDLATIVGAVPAELQDPPGKMAIEYLVEQLTKALEEVNRRPVLVRPDRFLLGGRQP